LKKWLYHIITGSLLINLFIGCDKCFFKKTSTGLQYKIATKGKGPKPQNGELLLMDMSYQTKDKKVLFSSTDSQSPIIIQYYDSIYYPDGGIFEAISMLEKGDSIIFKLPAKILLGNAFSELATTHKLKENTLIYAHMYVKDIQ